MIVPNRASTARPLNVRLLDVDQLTPASVGDLLDFADMLLNDGPVIR